MPNWLKSTLIRERDLFGTLPNTCMVPVTSPAGVVSAIVPAMVLDLIFASASRPPSAARCFSITSSAVCAWADVDGRTTSIASTTFDAVHLTKVMFVLPLETLGLSSFVVLLPSDFRLLTSNFFLAFGPIDVRRLAEEHFGRLHHRLGQRRVRMD